MMKPILTFVLLLYAMAGFAQNGNYFLAHYSAGKKNFNNVCFDIAQDDLGVMYFATKAGVMAFNGKDWELLKRRAAVYSIHITSAGQKFWAGADGFGRIGFDESGFQELETLVDSTSMDVVQCMSVEHNVYFLGSEQIYFFDTRSEKVSTIKTSDTGGINRLFELYGVVYASSETGEIYRIDDQKLVPSALDIKSEIVFISRIGNDYVFGTTDNKLFTLNEALQVNPVPIEDKEYADASVIVSGSWINRQLLALGTLRGGIMFINPITGKTQEIINYSTGLPDNEVFALMGDRNQNVWVAHEYGYTRISPFMPFRSFSHYPGLQGNLLCAFSSQNGVYVGTSLGLFKLTKEDIYDELIYFADVQVEEKIPETPVADKGNKTEAAKPDPQKSESKKRGIFAFLRRKKEKQITENASQDVQEIASQSPPPEASQPKYRKEKRTQKILRASQFVYEKVAGIDAKITNLVEVNGSLIASGLGGIFEVRGLRSKVLLKEPIHYLFASAHEKIIFASTYDDKVRSLVFETNQWKQADLLDRIDDQINFIFEGEDREFWVCGMDRIYQYQITDYNVNLMHSIDLSNSDAEKTLGISDGGVVMFANSQGFFRFDRSTRQLARVDSLPSPIQYFAQHGSMVYLDDHGWNLAGKLDSHANLKLLNLFHDLRFITTDVRDGDLWIISGSNELFKLFGERPIVDQESFPVILKSVTYQDQKKGYEISLTFSEDKSDITFEIAQSDYVSPDALEFRYMLQGMPKEEWTDWAAEHNAIHFPYLPPGDYTLQVQSRNILGKVTELKPFEFQVLPPYWKRSWFYAMEFAILASLVMLSFKLNTRYRIVSRILSLLTIILLIQFIQTLIDSFLPFEKESPVVAFVIQVFVALMILPVEGFLRKLMFRSLDSSYKFYQFISPRNQPVIVEKEETEELLPTDDH